MKRLHSHILKYMKHWNQLFLFLRSQIQLCCVHSRRISSEKFFGKIFCIRKVKNKTTKMASVKNMHAADLYHSYQQNDVNMKFFLTRLRHITTTMRVDSLTPLLWTRTKTIWRRLFPHIWTKNIKKNLGKIRKDNN